jgi:hypothetical protein
MRKLPSAKSIVWTDNACNTMTTLAPVVFLLALLVKLTGTVPGGRGRPDQPVTPEFANLLLASAATLVMILGVFVVLRVRRIWNLFDVGEEVEATVKKVLRFRGGARLKFEYEHGGTTYTAHAAFKRSSTTPEFEVGARIALLVDRLRPKRAVPLALYQAPQAHGRNAGAPSASSTPAAPEAFELRLGSPPSETSRPGQPR